MSNYDKALALASNRTTLRKRLQSARYCLARDLKKAFGSGLLDPIHYRLTGNNGMYLQWSVREHPNQPESYENQQTSGGFVQLILPE